MKYTMMILLVSAACGVVRAEDVSFTSLLGELTDDARLARLPVHDYRTHQASSYDRRSVAPGQPGWFANADWSHFIRVETNQNRIEHVMMEDEGPGAVVRFWNTWFSPMDGKLNHSTDGIIRLYLDGAPEPVIAASQSEWMKQKRIMPAPFVEIAPDTAPEHQRAYNVFLPIPYARGCKITYETKGQLGTVWNKGEAYYYAINYRRYAPGTSVRTFQLTDLQQHAPAISNAGQALDRMDLPASGTTGTSLPAGPLAPGASVKVELDGPAAVREIRLRFPAETGLVGALRSVELQLAFDGEPAAQCPVGDFFGTGTRLVPFRTRFLEAAAGGTLICRWVMPFRKQAVLTLSNKGAAPVELSGSIQTTPWVWNERSLHFRAHHAPLYQIEVRKEAEGARDIPFANIRGRGRLVGDALAVVNNAKQGFKWWGEGDEKIYIDGETFPSHFGTGTEDYYGYAHCRPEAFHSAFHAQPYGNGNLEPGDSLESRSSVNLRVRMLDDLPFRESLRFDMELWHWQTATMDYVPTTFYYLRPASGS